jgi:hypothetical protein
MNGFGSAAMKRLSRHTVVVLAVALLSSLGGMGLAVVAFGQDTGNPDANVPTGDYTATTPATAPLSGYTTTTTPTSGYTTSTPSTTPTTITTSPPSGGGSTPSKGSTGKTPSHSQASVTASGSLPSRATRSGPTHLAFTGGEPIALGAAGAALMLAGLGLHLRRRRATPGGPLA